ncbi:MAG: hypothetical protein HFI48_14660 [Lachnospiraceae bacterium]|nr:hypothetical protein [Lachnospiraceae bacterium]
MASTIAVMPEFREKKNVIILCDSWYVKKDLFSIVDKFETPDLIGIARSDSVPYHGCGEFQCGFFLLPHAVTKRDSKV